MIEITKGIYCNGKEVDSVRIKQVNEDGLASSVYIYLTNGEYIYLFFQTVEEARKFAVDLFCEININKDREG